jgi:hypothetical protein
MMSNARCPSSFACQVWLWITVQRGDRSVEQRSPRTNNTNRASGFMLTGGASGRHASLAQASRPVYRCGLRHSSSRSRRIAALSGFFDLSHVLDGPLR